MWRYATRSSVKSSPVIGLTGDVYVASRDGFLYAFTAPYPTSQPSSRPSTQPSIQPSGLPTLQPYSHPTSQPLVSPTSIPSRQPSSQPSRQPRSTPTSVPTQQPTNQPSNIPSTYPTSQPTRQPFSQPSKRPARVPTSQPSRQPTRQPTSQPLAIPTSPSSQPTRQPTSHPSNPSGQPTNQPSRPTCPPTTRNPSYEPKVPTPKPTVKVLTNVIIIQNIRGITQNEANSRKFKAVFKTAIAIACYRKEENDIEILQINSWLGGKSNDSNLMITNSYYHNQGTSLRFKLSQLFMNSNSSGITVKYRISTTNILFNALVTLLKNAIISNQITLALQNAGFLNANASILVTSISDLSPTSSPIQAPNLIVLPTMLIIYSVIGGTVGCCFLLCMVYLIFSATKRHKMKSRRRSYISQDEIVVF